MTDIAERWGSFTSDDLVTRRDLERIGDMVLGDMFLKGLGAYAEECVIPSHFPVVTEILSAEELLSPGVLWSLPEPWPYNELVGVVQEEIGRLNYATGLSAQRLEEIQNFHKEWFGPIEIPLLERIYAVYQRNDILNCLRQRSVRQQADDETFERVAKETFTNNMHGFVRCIAEAAYYGGMDESPIFNRMLEGFETGGFPCGWLGPLPEDGGDPVEAVAVFHLGKTVEASTTS